MLFNWFARKDLSKVNSRCRLRLLSREKNIIIDKVKQKNFLYDFNLERRLIKIKHINIKAVERYAVLLKLIKLLNLKYHIGKKDKIISNLCVAKFINFSI